LCLENEINMFKWFLILIAYIPFQIALNPGYGFDLSSLRVFIILLFLVCLIKIYQKCFKFYNLQAMSLFLFLILSGISLINAENISWGLRKIVFFISIFLIYFLVVTLIDNWIKIEKVIKILFIASGLFALIGLFQFLFQFIFKLEKVYGFWAVNVLPIFSGFNLGEMILAYPSWLVNVGGETIMRSFSLFSDPHMFSFYLGLIIPLVVILYFKNFNRILLFSIYFLLFIGLLLSFSRGAYFAIIITFLILSILLWRESGLRGRKLAILFCLSLLIFIIPITPISDRFYSSFDLNEGSNVGRLEMWQQAGEIGLNNFWSGMGLGNYSLEIDSDLDYRNPITAHNLYLDIFSEMGIFVLFIWLILILGTIGYLFQLIRDTKDNNIKYLSISLIGSLVYFSIHSSFETAIYQPSVLALLVIILGLSSILYVSKDN